MSKQKDPITVRFEAMKDVLNERQRRCLLAAEAKAIGRGGITQVAKAAGVSRNTIRAGLAEVDCPSHAAPKIEQTPSTVKKSRLRVRGGRKPVPEQDRQRQTGGGRKRTTSQDATLIPDLEALLEPFEAGDPCSPLRWTCKSVRTLTDELANQGHKTSTRMVHELLVELRYTMQGNKKTKESGSHEDRDQQFRFISDKAKSFQAAQQPVISVDTKKKELVGLFANKGSSWCPEGCPVEVNVHDFMDPEKGRASPYGIYDQTQNVGFVNVGLSADTSEFAVESIRRWWRSMGRESYPAATQLLITADGGGSNGSRVRLWKTELQRFADETGLLIAVCHFPPGTSKWNKIEHRLFSYISQNWRGRPLTSVETIVNLIGSTTTKPGLKVTAVVDANTYAKGIKKTDEEMASLKLTRNTFHGEWNYELNPSLN